MKKSLEQYINEYNLADVWSIPGYLPWAIGLSPQERTLLCQDNRDAYQKLFGTCTCTFRTEFFHRVWVFDSKFAISTAKGKGSSIMAPKTTTLEAAQEFTQWLLKQLWADAQNPNQ